MPHFISIKADDYALLLFPSRKHWFDARGCAVENLVGMDVQKKNLELISCEIHTGKKRLTHMQVLSTSF